MVMKLDAEQRRALRLLQPADGRCTRHAWRAPRQLNDVSRVTSMMSGVYVARRLLGLSAG